MKSAVLLSVAIILATQLLFAQFHRSNSGNMIPGPAATLPGVKEDATTDGVFTGKTTDKPTLYVPSQKKISENSLYRLEFDTEKGITLIGGNVADLLFRTTCLPLDLAAYEKLPNTNIQVMVNQKPTAIQATDLTTALRQIPAKQIKAIEISTDISENPDLAGEADIVIQVTRIK